MKISWRVSLGREGEVVVADVVEVEAGPAEMVVGLVGADFVAPQNDYAAFELERLESEQVERPLLVYQNLAALELVGGVD